MYLAKGDYAALVDLFSDVRISKKLTGPLLPISVTFLYLIL